MDTNRSSLVSYSSSDKESEHNLQPPAKKSKNAKNRDKLNTLIEQINSKDAIITLKDELIASRDQTINTKDELIASKDQTIKELIASRDQNIKMKDKIIDLLDVRITELSTELAFKKGFLNNRGMIEQFEIRWERGLSRTRLWERILAKSNCADLKRFLLSSNVGFYSVDSAVTSIVHAYDLLSNRIHQEPVSRELEVADDILNEEQAKFMSFICYKQQIRFQSRFSTREDIHNFITRSTRYVAQNDNILNETI